MLFNLMLIIRCWYEICTVILKEQEGIIELIIAAIAIVPLAHESQ